MPTDYDVIISGAGPAGIAIAARLAQLRPDMVSRLLILDRARFPRPKPCGGGLTGHATDAMAQLGLTLEVPAVAAPGSVVRFGSFERGVPLARPVKIVRRTEFDHSLVEQVERRGVEVRQGEGMAEYSVGPSQARVVTTAGRALSARVLVGADGAGSLVRSRLARWRRRPPHRLFTAEIEVDEGTSVEPVMRYDFTPMRDGLRGYLWVFPVTDRHVNVGVLHYAQRPGPSGAQLVGLLRRGLADHGLDLGRARPRGWPVWGYHPRSPVAAERVIVVGDAAGVDSLTGEGIAVAMEQAIVAGDCVVEGLATGDFRFASYRRRLRRATVGRELALDRWLAWLLYGGRRRWRHWLPLVLFDPYVLEMYARRVDGAAVLADRKPALYWSLTRHAAQLLPRRRALAQALATNRLRPPATVGF